MLWPHAHDPAQTYTLWVLVRMCCPWLQVKVEHGPAFEDVWRSRESRLKDMPGFVRFAMLKCEFKITFGIARMSGCGYMRAQWLKILFD